MSTRSCRFVRTSFAVSVSAITSHLAIVGSAEADNFTYNLQQASGANWSAAIWQPGNVSPTAGNTYEVLAGGRLRTPDGSTGQGGTGGNGQMFTFPGDSLKLDGPGFATSGSGELRIKQAFTNAVFNFPGVGGNPGLILNGGIINDGDNFIQTVSGSISAVAGTTSSFNPGGQAVTDISAQRGFILTATLSGSGGMSLDYGPDTTTSGATVHALLINGFYPKFSGNWTINSGWIEAAGLNSMGFGNISLKSTLGASTLDFDYNISNPTGSLVLATTTSKLILDQSLTFGSVMINGTSLTPGLHTFAELNASFDANFVEGGTGSITVVPEPAGAAMALLGGVALILFRRRR
jgi:hypothetical protein